MKGKDGRVWGKVFLAKIGPFWVVVYVRVAFGVVKKDYFLTNAIL